jgi:hypothetical protein
MLDCHKSLSQFDAGILASLGMNNVCDADTLDEGESKSFVPDVVGRQGASICWTKMEVENSCVDCNYGRVEGPLYRLQI